MTEEDALAWVAELFEHPVQSVAKDTPRDDIPGWDSLGVLSLMAGLDEKFGIQVTADDLEQMKEVGDILILLKASKRLD